MTYFRNVCMWVSEQEHTFIHIHIYNINVSKCCNRNREIYQYAKAMEFYLYRINCEHARMTTAIAAATTAAAASHRNECMIEQRTNYVMKLFETMGLMTSSVSSLSYLINVHSTLLFECIRIRCANNCLMSASNSADHLQ